MGHPFGNRFATKRFRKLFKELPFDVVYGNTDIQTRHLLGIMKSNIARADYAIFDLSDWNPNVSLELGLTEGLSRRRLKDYYILLNTRRSQEVPSDIRGIQRLEYTRYDYKPGAGLGDVLVDSILRKEFWVKKIRKEVGNDEKSSKLLLLALRIIAHLRDNEKLTSENIKTLVRGTRLRSPDQERVLVLLRKLRLVRKGSKALVYVRWKTVFRR
ncbi:MAG: hypothetical protein HYZ93_05970 [Candidatus Omnitrophica bacterium]|nr:hypothetical protein [Candidatus Omnitrophota bacterium]